MGGAAAETAPSTLPILLAACVHVHMRLVPLTLDFFPLYLPFSISININVHCCLSIKSLNIMSWGGGECSPFSPFSPLMLCRWIWWQSLVCFSNLWWLWACIWTQVREFDLTHCFNKKCRRRTTQMFRVWEAEFFQACICSLCSLTSTPTSSSYTFLWNCHTYIFFQQRAKDVLTHM